MAKKETNKKSEQAALARPAKTPKLVTKPGSGIQLLATRIMLRDWMERNPILASGIALLIIALMGMLLANKLSNR